MPPMQTFIGFVTRFFPMNVCWNEPLNSFPFLSKYHPDIMCKSQKNQSALGDFFFFFW